MGGSSSESISNSTKENIGILTMVIGIVLFIVGALWIFDDYVVSQMAGAFLLILGFLIVSLGALLYGNDRINTVLFWRPPGLVRFVVILVLIVFSLVMPAYNGTI